MTIILNGVLLKKMMMGDGEVVPVLILGEKHLLAAPVGSEHSYKDVGVSTCVLCVTCDRRHFINHLRKRDDDILSAHLRASGAARQVKRHTFRMILMVVASRMLKTRAVRPSPRSLANQHLHVKLY